MPQERISVISELIALSHVMEFTLNGKGSHLTLIVPCVIIVLLDSLPITAAIFESHCFCVPPHSGIQ